MARALIVGCGCRGRELGEALLADGWVVRGTTRSDAASGAIAAAGIEPAIADPDRIATVLEAIEGVSLIYWLMGSAEGEPDALAALHGPRLARLLEEIVDTPVRAVVFEITAAFEPEHAASALGVLRDAGQRWRIPFEVVDGDPGRPDLWLEAMLASGRELLA